MTTRYVPRPRAGARGAPARFWLRATGAALVRCLAGSSPVARRPAAAPAQTRRTPPAHPERSDDLS